MIGFEKLNDMQKKAVLQTEGPVLILAGAGSGKTGALTVRIAHIIENKGVAPWNILAITFTNKAAKEMKERVMSLVGDDGKNIWISTFHSTCVRILRQYAEKIGYTKSFSIYDDDDKEKAIKEAFKTLNFPINDKSYSVRSAMSEISRAKDELISWEEYQQKTDNNPLKLRHSKVYKVYNEILKKSNSMDFDDLIYNTVLLFKTNPDVLEYYQDKFRYIMVDEYQDTNVSQYELVRLLAAKYGNLCVVGDDDQSIYGWRGADIRNILDFEKDFKNTVVIKLEQNYRSTQNILEAANSVIHNNETRKDKKLWTENEKGSIIHAFRADNEQEEAKFVADKIKSIVVKEGKKYSDFAVLYRTNAQSRAVEDQLIKKDVPYRLFGGVRFYERREIKDVISYLKAIANPNDNIALMRIINVPKRGIGDSSVEKVAAYASKNDMSFFEALKNLDDITELKTRVKKMEVFYNIMNELIELSNELGIVELLEAVLDKTGYKASIEEQDTEEAMGRLENIGEFISKAADFEANSDDNSLSVFLEEVALVADIDSYTEGMDTTVLMTLHSAKGLEFPYVFIIGMEEGVFPTYKSINYGGLNGIEEERRLCYVGITRAEKELYLLYAKSRLMNGITEYKSPSRFLKELPEDIVEKPKFTERPKFQSPLSRAKAGESAFKPNPYGMGGIIKSKVNNDIPSPIDRDVDISVGDKVRAPKYGIGTVLKITPGGADYEIEIDFGEKGKKKFMKTLCKLKKIE